MNYSKFHKVKNGYKKKVQDDPEAKLFKTFPELRNISVVLKTITVTTESKLSPERLDKLHRNIASWAVNNFIELHRRKPVQFLSLAA